MSIKRCWIALCFAITIAGICGCQVSTYSYSYLNGHIPGEVMGGCPSLYEWNRNNSELKRRLLAAKDGRDLDLIFGQSCAASCMDSRGVEWRFWYAKQEWPDGNLWRYKAYLVTVTLRDGKVVGFVDVENPPTVIGDHEWNDECMWCFTKYVLPHYTEHVDRLNGVRYFFDDESYHYVKDTYDKVVDHWENGNAVWKKLDLQPGYTRYYGTNTVGSVVYYDLPPGWTCRGFNPNTSVFSIDPPPCKPGLRRVWHGDKFCDIPADATYLGYDNGFQYRTREDMVSSIVAAGLSSMMQSMATINQQQPVINGRQSYNGSGIKNANSSSAASSGVPSRPRCEKHDCERDALGHCPVCNAGFRVF